MRRPATLAVFLSLFALFFLTGCNKLRARDELNKGVRAYKAAQFETAIGHFQRAVELDPKLLNARIYLATAYASQFVPGSPAEENKKLGQSAIHEFEKVLEVDPNNTTALAYIASLYYGMTDFDKAKEFRRRLIAVDPTNPEHYYSIGVIDWTLAYKPRMELKNKLGLRPDEPIPARDRRALAEKNTPLVDEGIEALEKAIQLNPNYVDALAYLNLLYREKADIGDTPQEREHYLDLADQMFDRQKRLREEMTRGPAPAR